MKQEKYLEELKTIVATNDNIIKEAGINYKFVNKDNRVTVDRYEGHPIKDAYNAYEVGIVGHEDTMFDLVGDTSGSVNHALVANYVMDIKGYGYGYLDINLSSFAHAELLLLANDKTAKNTILATALVLIDGIGQNYYFLLKDKGVANRLQFVTSILREVDLKLVEQFLRGQATKGEVAEDITTGVLKYLLAYENEGNIL